MFATHGAATNDPIWNGLQSITEGKSHNASVLVRIPKSGRTLRTPTFTLTDGNLACLVEGTGHVIACVDSHRMIHGPLHGQTVKQIKEGNRWVSLNLGRYVGHRLHLEFVPAPEATLAVRLVVQGVDAEGLQRIDTLCGQLDADYEQFARRAEAFLAGPAEADQEASRQAAPQEPEVAKLASAAGAADDAGRRAADSILEAWRQERERLQAKIVVSSRLAPAMLDGTGEDDHVLIRGNSSKPGQVAPRQFLTAIAGDAPMTIPHGSGRLELAAQINDSENPLTSRVIVNRIWHHLMGRGLVPTTDDFGVLGRRPTHPQLLDHLATQFLANGRSIKQTIRYIVLSRTYQMSTMVDAAALAEDPDNLLWHHRPPKRLEGEAIRDSLLALAGNLDAAPHGPAVPVHLTPFMDGRGRPKQSGPLDGNGRRSIYVAVRRNFLSPFMLAFDAPVPFNTMGRRNVSNVPAQALILMNDPFVLAQARGWAEQAMQQGETTSERIDWMYRTGVARRPTARELEAAMAFVGRANSEEAWTDLAHALINTKEFLFLR